MMPTLLLAVHLAAGQPAAYPRADLLVEADDPKLAADFRVLDARPAARYAEGHVPGAVSVDAGPWSKAVVEGKADAAFWKAELAKVGVGPKRPVAVYADDARDAARVWWMLKYAGVPDVRVVNGGWQAYAAAKRPVQKEAVTAAADPHDWKPAADRLASKGDVLTQRKAGGILDARSAGEFAGAEKGKNKKAGCVPGAVHVEWSDFLDPKTGKYLPPPDLIRLVKDRKVDLDEPNITYCQGGGRAAVAAFGLELAGARNVRNYYPGWGEWGNDPDTPVEVKKK
jgi:thiosulfate/3-mercaptopyruvate sulfurtransferase